MQVFKSRQINSVYVSEISNIYKLCTRGNTTHNQLILPITISFFRKNLQTNVKFYYQCALTQNWTHQCYQFQGKSMIKYIIVEHLYIAVSTWVQNQIEQMEFHLRSIRKISDTHTCQKMLLELNKFQQPGTIHIFLFVQLTLTF